MMILWNQEKLLKLLEKKENKNYLSNKLSSMAKRELLMKMESSKKVKRL